jgi:phage recombination protein Bet
VSLVPSYGYAAGPPEPRVYTEDEKDLVKRVCMAKGTTDDEFRLFMAIVMKTGLDPLAKQIYAITRDGRMTIQTGIDGYRLIAARTHQFAGEDDALFDHEGTEHPNKATVTVYRLVHNQRMPFTASARWAEYVATDRHGKPANKWASMPYTMLAKCAEALALRKAFPAELSGLYSDEEMGQADNPPAASTSSKRVTVDAEPAKPVAPTFKDLRLRAFAAGVANMEDWEACCIQYGGTTDPSKMTADGKAALLEYVESLERTI